jgi:hypothetical protein
VQGDENISESAAPVETSSPAADVSSHASETTQSPETKVSETSGEQSKETLLDAVLKVAPATPEEDVLAAPKTEDAPSSNEAESEVKAEDEASESETDETPEDDTVPEGVPAQTRKKINKLLRERRTLRDEVASMRPVAEIGQQLQNYAQENSLSSDDVVFALDLASMVARGDMAGFYQVISPLVRHAQELTGVVLPPDLQGMVDQGQMTPDVAHQFAKTRFEKVNYEAQNRQIQQRQQVEQVTQVRGDVQRSVAAFEQRLMANDPDYKAKAEMVRRTAQAILAEHGGQISSAQEAVAITQRAYDEVNKQFRRLQPTARPTSPTPGISNPQTPVTRAAPKNMMEAALSGLARSRAG